MCGNNALYYYIKIPSSRESTCILFDNIQKSLKDFVTSAKMYIFAQLKYIKLRS